MNLSSSWFPKIHTLNYSLKNINNSLCLHGCTLFTRLYSVYTFALCLHGCILFSWLHAVYMGTFYLGVTLWDLEKRSGRHFWEGLGWYKHLRGSSDWIQASQWYWAYRMPFSHSRSMNSLVKEVVPDSPQGIFPILFWFKFNLRPCGNM